MGKRVLFITESYDQNPSPNGNCVKIVADELVSRGNHAYVLTLKNQIARQDAVVDGVCVKRVNTYAEWRCVFAQNVPQMVKRCVSKFVKVLKYIFIPLHPFRSPGVLWSLYRAGSAMIEQENIDTVVGVYRDFETAYAGLLLKKKYPQVKLCIYTLDAISGGVCSNPFVKKEQHMEKCRQWEIRFLQVCDAFCIMKAHAPIFRDPLYQAYQDKILALDIPNLRIPVCAQQSGNPSDVLRFVFTGMLSETNADCTYFLDVFRELQKRIPTRFDIYGAVSDGMMDTLKNSGMYNQQVFFHGRVSQEELASIREQADVFLNFGNTHFCGIPCKIFEYISTRKMIVSFYKIDNDASYSYLSRYPKALLLRESEGREAEYAEAIVQFWHEKKDVEISLDDITREFYDNTPAAFIEVLEKR